MRRKLILAAGMVLILAGVVFVAFRFGILVGKRQAVPPDRMDKVVETLPRTRQVDLYFADPNGRRLSLERREVTGENLGDLLRKVVEELIRGPAETSRLRTLPGSSRIRALFFREGTVWVDLDSTVREDHPGGAWTELLAVYSVVNTLAENFAEVQRVQILIEGSESDTLAGHVDISRPLESRIQLLAGDWE